MNQWVLIVCVAAYAACWLVGFCVGWLFGRRDEKRRRWRIICQKPILRK